ncbi:D-alanyl-D-alanine carboxypeptidase/D-alanyl-D-alanine-endopeptidase [Ideonella sp. 4Y16]|uniref:D-alanyl-D-alanine carboxypeptidase/D-alanyl-D-alanine-endopeptidase n=1 Tax=Ideonella alba TaxID=2824118 RepID=A0A940YHI4_9BURK|nr:D-alanyl-D-alanine carboxypeptidase/D-alanyl-D-alanine-endopeptidase [Ideonella alba]MBQ0930014.1 D-alanyl-D-alanine carboxypeptidase/D-alanyl-D-alanine-endopeptidase [Ideonella alba]MBQ0946074.1 D-alanyl-D-alanine carboxypeptidase/D-alanyl-D-alanine-endopeptidase [Ideonella alba]
MHRLPALGALLLALLAPAARAQSPLPPEVHQALQRAKLPESALSAVVLEAEGGQRRLAVGEQLPINPASVFKLLPTYAALDQLGPAWTWSTPVFVSGTLQGGVLDGSLAIRGSGDPKLVQERLWLMLRRVQQLGVREIRGDILLDRGAFMVPETSPAEFDGDPSRPYNVRPDALMLNYKAVVLGFVPDTAHGQALVTVDPPLAGYSVDATVPLSAGPCDDWRGALKASVGDPARLRFAGAFPGSCGEKSWPLAHPDPKGFNARLVEQLWRELGGKLAGSVRDGSVPAGARLLFEQASPPLLEVVREINKFSNNVMAEQLFLTLPLAARSLPAGASVRPEDAREHLRRWLRERLGEEATKEVVIDNGSGLSRETRVSAALLARLLQQAWSSPVMSELMGSLPISGTDGTLRRSTATAGRAHLKTGSLRDVAAVAGYVLSNSGRRYVLVAVLNHPNASAGRPALDALVQWAIRDTPAR